MRKTEFNLMFLIDIFPSSASNVANMKAVLTSSGHNVAVVNDLLSWSTCLNTQIKQKEFFFLGTDSYAGRINLTEQVRYVTPDLFLILSSVATVAVNNNVCLFCMASFKRLELILLSMS